MNKLLSTLGLCLTATVASGQHTLNFDRPEVAGMVHDVAGVLTQNVQQTVTANGEVVQESDVTQTIDIAYREETLAVDDDGDATARLIRISGGEFAIDDGEPQPITPAVCRTEWVDGAATFTIEEGELPSAVAAFIQEILEVTDPDAPEAEDALDPGQPVDIGDEWEIDRTKIIEGIGDSMPLSEENFSDATATLYGVVDGVQTVGMTIRVAIDQAPADPGMPPVESVEGELFLEGSMQLEAGNENPAVGEYQRMEMTMKIQLEGQPVTIDVNYSRTGQTQSTLVNEPAGAAAE